MREKLTVALLATAIVLSVVATRALLIATKDAHQTAISYQQVATELQRDLHTITQQATDKTNGIAPILKETHETVRQTRKLIDVALATSLEERASMRRASDESVAILSHADSLISHLDSKVDPMTDSLLRVTSQSEQTLKSSAEAMDAAAGVLSSPELRMSLTNLSGATQELNGSMSDVHQVTTHYRQEILAPVSRLKQAWSFTETFLADLATKFIP